jgi:trigger factor
MSYTYKIKSLPKSAKEATIEIKWDLISKHKDSVITRAIATVQVPGFRTGKAPRPMAEKMLNMDKIYEETVRETIPEIYKAILEKEKLNPITTPSVSLTEAKEGETWKLTMTIPLVPEVKLKDYKKYIKNEKVKMEKEKDAIAASKEAASKKEPDAQSKSDEPNAELAASSSKLEAEKPPVSADDYARLQKQLEELNKQVARQKAELEKANSLINKLQTYLKSFFNLK